MKTALVKFSVGVKHPLYNKVVEAEILNENAGYDGRGTYASTIEKVYYPEDKEGILVFQDGEFKRYKTRPAYYEFHEGWIERATEI